MMACGGRTDTRVRKNGHMRIASKAIWLLIFAFLLGSYARAEDKLEIKLGKIGGNPPFTVSGWRYQLMNNNIHMHICASSLCEPGSKVSYVVMPPMKNAPFEQFKGRCETIARVLRQKATAGTRIECGEPEKIEDKLYRIFKVKREEIAPDGKRTVTLSQLVMADRVAFDFISSASTLKKAEEHVAPFMLAGMMIAVKDK